MFRLGPIDLTARPRLLLACAALPVAYVISGGLGLLLAVPPGYATAIFPPAGIAVAAMFVAGAATLPWTFLGSFLLNVWVGYSFTHRLDETGISAALAIAFASMLQAAIGGAALRSAVGYPAPLDNVRDLVRFLLLSPVFCLTSATLSLSGMWALGAVQVPDLLANWITWWIGDTLGVLVVLPLMLVLAGEPRSLWRDRAPFVGIPMVLFFALFVAIFVRVSKWENDQSLLEFRMRSQHLADMMHSSLEEQGIFLEQLAVAVASRHQALTRQDFHDLVQKLLQRFPTIQAVEWAPRVMRAERPTFEAAQQSDLPDFAIRERDPSGELRPAADRAQFYPVTYVEPLSGNETAAGFDLASHADRGAAIVTAIASGNVSATAPIRLVQEQGEQVGILLTCAVPDGSSGPGIVLVVLRMGTFTKALLGPLQSAASVQFVDAVSGRPFFDDFPAFAAASYEAAFNFGTRRYLVRTQPTPLYLAEHRGWQSWVLLVAGAFSTGLLGALLMLGTGQTHRFQRLIDDRTRDLQETNRRLKVEMEERRQAEAALHQAQRMEAVGHLTGGIAHDFNNLLMIVNGSVARLRRELGGEKCKRFLDMIATATQRGEKLTRQLLSFSRRQSLKPQVVDLAQLVSHMTELLKRSLRGDIEIKIDVPDTVCAANVDPGELELAILNLAVNAQDAMPQGGALTLAVDPVTLKGETAADGLEGEFYAVGLTDTGIGIPADRLPRVFEPFYTTKEFGKGTGLGLSQVYGFAKQSGGSATISSAPDRGTNVTLYLPRSHAVPEPSGVPARIEPIEAPSGDGATVLVAEDDADVAAVCTAQLGELGYQVECVSNGHAALEVLKTNRMIRFVLSDILMPGGINGLELARLVRDRHPRVAVVLTTGYGGNAQEPASEGFLVLKKPFDIAALANALQQALKEQELQPVRGIVSRENAR